MSFTLLESRPITIDCSASGGTTIVGFQPGYPTYALYMVDPFDALRSIKDVGYEALEICLSESGPSSSLRFSFRR